MTKEELEKESEEWLDDAIHRIVRLEEENAELKCECRRCVHTDCPCVLSDFGKDRNGICDHFKDIFDENVELEKKNTELRLKLDALEGQTPWKDIKDKSELIGKLTKATELLRFWVNDFYDGFNNLNRYEERHKALEQSEQFLKKNI